MDADADGLTGSHHRPEWCFYTSLIAALYLAIYVIFVHESTERRHCRFACAVLQDLAVHLEEQMCSFSVQTKHLRLKHDKLNTCFETLGGKVKVAEKQLFFEHKQRVAKESISSKLLAKVESLDNEIQLVSRDLRQQRKQRAHLEHHLKLLRSSLVHYGILEKSELAEVDADCHQKQPSTTGVCSEGSPSSTVSYTTISSPTETVGSDFQVRSAEFSYMNASDDDCIAQRSKSSSVRCSALPGASVRHKYYDSLSNLSRCSFPVPTPDLCFDNPTATTTRKDACPLTSLIPSSKQNSSS
eukprot:TRINITY_DN10899_c0_g1_i2.p1 TRINITY_DN10899_c0_g1~~TRINITY_DN10899_c0_g1_i2.p1  ORF type:complete len:299 (+),score=36.23 TRINITY_DN10899_c0_g1_i2:53-949(+)